ncbi:complex I subunit 5 family protein [Rhodocyclaceae bacterium SMB388]
MNAAIDGFGLVLAPTLPLVMLIAWCVPGFRGRIACWLPYAAVPALLLALGGESGAVARLDGFLFGAVLALDELNRVFLAFTALLWLGAGWHARGHLAGDPDADGFRLLWFATMSGNFGLILAQDVASFYAAFALMTFAAYGLVIHSRSADAIRAGRIYLIMAILGEALILSGLLFAAAGVAAPLTVLMSELPGAIAVSSRRDLIIACLFAGFGIKAGLPLLHLWLPLAHPVAPVPASAVLSGAMIKAGLLGWLTTLPLGLVSLPGWSLAVMLTGFIAAFGAALIGVNQRTPKAVLAYSSVSQMGLMTVGVGAALQAPEAWPVLASAIALYALHHGLAKGALFLGVGIAARAGGRLSNPRSRWLWLALALPGLSLAGPMVSGMAAKTSLKAAFEAGLQLPAWWTQLPLMMGVAAIGTTGLIARHLWLLRDIAQGEPASRSEWLGWGFTLAASSLGLILLPWLPVPTPWPDALRALPDLIWPVLAGGLLAVLAHRHLKTWPIPAGDALIPIEGLIRRFRIGWRKTARGMGRCLQTMRTGLSGWIRMPDLTREYGSPLERAGRRETGLAFAVLLVLMLIALMFG